MNILLLYANNPFKASGVATLNLFNELKQCGHNVKLVTNRYDSGYPIGIVSMERYYSSLWKSSKLRYKLDGVRRKLKLIKEVIYDNKYHFSEYPENKSFYRTKSILRKAEIEPDIVLISFAKGFINTKNIFELFELTKVRIYWLMYDMSPITGGCHYAWDCNGYLTNCSLCPALTSSDPSDAAYKNLLLKKSNIDKSNVELIAASEWQYRQAIASSLFKNKKIHKILLSADPEIFKPFDKVNKRSIIGIPGNKRVIFFGSIELTLMRKGMIYLLECLKILKQKIENTKLENNIFLLIAGRDISGIVSDLPFDYHFLGLIDDTTKMASAYQMADVFICPSIEDSGPMMINQSVMAGTPVVSFEMGVALDLVITGRTGYRAGNRDSNDMAQGLYSILSLSDQNYKEMSNNCRELAMNVCSPEVQIESFERLFKT